MGSGPPGLPKAWRPAAGGGAFSGVRGPGARGGGGFPDRERGCIPAYGLGRREPGGDRLPGGSAEKCGGLPSLRPGGSCPWLPSVYGRRIPGGVRTDRGTYGGEHGLPSHQCLRQGQVGVLQPGTASLPGAGDGFLPPALFQRLRHRGSPLVHYLHPGAGAAQGREGVPKRLPARLEFYVY